MSTNVDIEMQHDILLTQAAPKSSSRPKVAIAAGLLLVVGTLGSMSVHSAGVADVKSTVTTDLRKVVEASKEAQNAVIAKVEATKAVADAKAIGGAAAAKSAKDSTDIVLATVAVANGKDVNPEVVKAKEEDKVKQLKISAAAIEPVKEAEKDKVKAAADAAKVEIGEIKKLAKAVNDVATKPTIVNSKEAAKVAAEADKALDAQTEATKKNIEIAKNEMLQKTINSNMEIDKLKLDLNQKKLEANIVKAAVGEKSNDVNTIVKDSENLVKKIGAESKAAQELADTTAKLKESANKKEKEAASANANAANTVIASANEKK